MDKIGDKLDEAGAQQIELVSRAGGPKRASGRAWKSELESVSTSLRSEVIASHFEPREWRLASHSSRAFDHGLLLLSGEAKLAAAGDPLHVLAPSFAWIPAGVIDRLEMAAGASGHLMAMKPELVEHTFRQIPEAGELLGLLAARQPLALAVDKDVADVLSGAMGLVARELHDLKPGAQTLVSSALVICLIQLWRHVGASALMGEGLGGSAALLMRFRQLVEERFREHWPVACYATALGVSPDRLHAICTRTLGRSPRVLIQQRILYEAVSRLERSSITIKQLAFVLGFKDTAYFTRFFCKRLGDPPAKYRRDIAQRDAAQRMRPTRFTFSDWP